jgi:hypothetical protein
MPKLEKGRDAYGVFQLYPQFSGLLTQILFAGLTNLGFVLALVAGLQLHHLRPLLAHQPGVIFVVAALVAGFAVGLTLYPKEHFLTSSVLRPWRRLEGILVGLTIAVPITSVWQWHQVVDSSSLQLPMGFLWLEAGLDVLVFAILVLACVRPYKAETSGGWLWRRKGLAIRRRSFPHHGQVVDDRELARRESDPANWSKWLEARKTREQEKSKVIRTRFVNKYLVERERQSLFNRGIPPASRHARDQRSD